MARLVLTVRVEGSGLVSFCVLDCWLSLVFFLRTTGGFPQSGSCTGGSALGPTPVPAPFRAEETPGTPCGLRAETPFD